MKKQHGLAKQFMGMIALAALESVLLLTVSQVVLSKGLHFYFDRSEVQNELTQRQVDELQEYVDENHLASTDVRKITAWAHKRRYILLELYRDRKLIYSSFAPKGARLEENDEQTPFYDWTPHYSIRFADGDTEAMLYYNGFNTSLF